MASHTNIVRAKRKRRHKNAGHVRKAALARRSTLSYAELFSPFGAPKDEKASSTVPRTPQD